MRIANKFLTVILSIAVIGAGAAVAKVTSKSATQDSNASQVQYRAKPGCGPKKTDGQAGNSGTHTGQPPKADNRADCPPNNK